MQISSSIFSGSFNQAMAFQKRHASIPARNPGLFRHAKPKDSRHGRSTSASLCLAQEMCHQPEHPGFNAVDLPALAGQK
ncbi:hypothetical protein MAPG_07887 [Magnaporthiopsis poae ATCC 64411]|uniref:Uncharacterized protein n=1 Tax=Magnaporthiopsis poae (strain ATCC 64411 / 73-15) TaxID=644358 RepID=A0A0C4E5W0_MAGP6|nr:hypothetical protein MAPG_07887 [Magnaporthiopsis poae ATCC 64411]